MNTSSSMRREALVCAILAGLLPLLLYLHGLGYAFVYDDSELIISRLPPRSVGDWISTALSPYYRGLPYYRPLPGLLFAVERHVFSLNPFGYHLTNLVIVCLLGISLYSLLRLPLFALDPLTAFAISAICSAHPITSSVVYMISGREALLSAFFLVLTCRFFLQGQFGWRAAGTLFCALTCRESSVFILPLPGLIILSRLRGPEKRQALADLARLAGITVLYFALRHFALSGEDSTTRLAGNWILVPISYLYAFSSILLPTALLQYEPELNEWLTAPRMILSGTLLLLISLLPRPRSLQLTPARSALLLGLFSILPTANIFEQETPFDERHLLAPMILLTVSLGLALHQLPKRRQALQRRVLLLPLLILIPVSFSRGISFSNDDRFFDHWITISPDNSKVINHLAAREMAEGNIPEALKLLDRSIDLRGNSSGFLYRGRVQRILNNLPAARKDIESALDLDPQDAIAWCDLGFVERLQGNRELAELRFAEATRRNGDVWCAKEPHSFWERAITARGNALHVFPISTREELRNYDESRTMPPG